MIFLSLFLSFFLVGLVGFGGDYSLLAFLQHILVTHTGWLTPSEFTDLMGMCRIVPGSICLNSAAWGGYAAVSGRLGFWPALGGSAVAAVSLALPAFLWTAIVNKLRGNAWAGSVLESVMSLLRPLVPGIVAAAALMLMNKENFGSPALSPWQFGISIFLFFSTVVGICFYRFNALFMVLLCGVAGWLLL